jgi:hypothetical protein
LRQNLKSADRFIAPASALARLSALARNAVLAAAVAALSPPFASANPVPADDQKPAGISLEFDKANGRLDIEWSGPIVPGMAEDLRTAVGRYEADVKRIVLFLDSAGGQVEEGDRVIAVLNEIKRRYRLATVVLHGKLCASMCIPIFLQGNDRLAARASLWIFHEAGQRQANGAQRSDRTETWRLFRKYYAPAGVSMHWLKSIVPMINGAELWKTGGDLIDAKTGIIMYVLSDTTARATAASPADAALAPRGDNGLHYSAAEQAARRGSVNIRTR